MNPVTSAGLTIRPTLPLLERSGTVDKGILKGNCSSDLETPTEAEKRAAPTEGNLADLTRPVGEQPLFGAWLP
jgi:hypothetical protein